MADKVRTSLYIDNLILRELKQNALDNDMKVNEIIVNLIKDYLYNNDTSAKR